MIDLAAMRRRDSGVRGGPKAAFLGELQHLFPDKVARGIVVPFGAYYAHYRAARVALPRELAGEGIAQAGEPLEDFVKRTYATFFDEMIPAGERRARAGRLDPAAARGDPPLARGPPARARAARGRSAPGSSARGCCSRTIRPRPWACFVRSDTNVEDLDDFNGAGLNLTLFNRRSLDDVYAALTGGLGLALQLPLLLVAADADRRAALGAALGGDPRKRTHDEIGGARHRRPRRIGDRTKMLVATSEGVGGAVDGTPAETLVWSPAGVELVTMFKSPYRRLLRPDGGSEIVASTGSEYVLSADELAELVATAARIRDEFEPSVDPAGNPRPWDIEFGFAGGKLWLFQARPFIGNESLANVPALAAYEVPRRGAGERVSLDEVIQ